ncbi:hypothetical protein Gohar_018600 [Gossypium harknessii]|uniref:Uncharacterized protein n=1 Tax=Gossypium harknessii TaxID=34285 RepID=A0A7J9G9I0_9ROSI|nr:hypothetical protein [Gossypium harknessii]
MKMITCDRLTYGAVMMAHKKYGPFLNKSIDHYCNGLNLGLSEKWFRNHKSDLKRNLF